MAQLDQQKVPLEKKPVDLAPIALTSQPPDTGALLDKIDGVLGGKIRVTHGANDQEFENLVGKTVASVRKSLTTAYGIPRDAQPYIKGQVVQEDYKLAQGDQLEFLKQSGTKGIS